MCFQADLYRLPRCNKWRPDFMAPGRQVKIRKGLSFGIRFEDDEEDIIPGDDFACVGEGERFRYYESKKIIGTLYRAIDERSFFKDLHIRGGVVDSNDSSKDSLLIKLREYVQHKTAEAEWDFLYTQPRF